MKILQINYKGHVIGSYDSPSQAAKETGLDASHITKVLKGKRSSHRGYKWKYSDEGLDTPASDDSTSNRRVEYRDDSAILSGKTERSITSKEEAIAFFDVDVDVWDVERYIVNSWDVTMKGPDGDPIKRTNYQVKVWLKKKMATVEEVSFEITQVLKNHKPRLINVMKGAGTITVELADFHIGAEITGLMRTKDFGIEVLDDYLYSVAEIANSYNADNVVINLHGDFVESITGLNHDDVWKSMGKGMYGANVLILANEIIGGSLISKINNVTEVNMVSGNHDRISAKKSIDNVGEAAKLLAWTLQRDFPEITINFDGIVLVREIDGINHILTHGHLGISKRDLTKVVADYGRSDMFNLWSEGHLHSRTYKKVMRSKHSIRYENVDYVQLDEMNYRKLILPPLFTGNFYSESLGYASWAGVVITQNNGNGVPNIHDYTL